ncbi:MAG: hypothetical protein ACLFSY_08045 [Desulfonatronovibrionaceae bacterium]
MTVALMYMWYMQMSCIYSQALPVNPRPGGADKVCTACGQAESKNGVSG